MELFECSRLSAADLLTSRVVARVDLFQSSSAAVVRVDRRRSSLAVIVRFYFGLSEDTQQTVGAMFVGGEMLRSSYNEIRGTLDGMTNNSQEWKDDGFGSQQEDRRNRGNKDRDDGVDRNVIVALEGQVTEMSKLL
ncbi:hypothetical protein E5676_scaffold8046G00030 [Cucumis melo var. makuwa]|uniref:Uncharacterized protein n=1 Tax=Cucumis melo var. makuwa TaxID=1194695 RepID=A0A5D3CV99_CUCMM|nr:hypothetical protein E6C27_scaffold30G00060 [Cucumis melo var. makuwa]TYK14179.1 hypothetical protein E5676_scaffold8046G00030 [Cucumis melo var. makuwa]